MPTVNGSVNAQGCLVTLWISVRDARRRALLRCGFPVPPPVQVRAVVDTGSFITLADNLSLASLGVAPHGNWQILSSASGTAPQTRPAYDFSVTLVNDAGLLVASWPSVEVLGAIYPAADVVHGVFGRDLLASAVFHYDGSSSSFSLTF